MFLLMCVYDFSRADLMTKRLVMCTGGEHTIDSATEEESQTFFARSLYKSLPLSPVPSVGHSVQRRRVLSTSR